MKSSLNKKVGKGIMPKRSFISKLKIEQNSPDEINVKLNEMLGDNFKTDIEKDKLYISFIKPSIRKYSKTKVLYPSFVNTTIQLPYVVNDENVVCYNDKGHLFFKLKIKPHINQTGQYANVS